MRRHCWSGGISPLRLPATVGVCRAGGETLPRASRRDASLRPSARRRRSVPASRRKCTRPTDARGRRAGCGAAGNTGRSHQPREMGNHVAHDGADRLTADGHRRLHRSRRDCPDRSTGQQGKRRVQGRHSGLAESRCIDVHDDLSAPRQDHHLEDDIRRRHL